MNIEELKELVATVPNMEHRQFLERRLRTVERTLKEIEREAKKRSS